VNCHADVQLGDRGPLYFTVDVANAIGTGAASNVAALTPPGAPTNLTAASASGTTTRLSWTVPPNGGDSITGYNIYSSSTSGGTKSAYNTSGTVAGTCAAGTCTYDITPGTGTSYFIVKAVNRIGESAASNEIALTPGAPTSLVAAYLTATKTRLTWTAPPDGGSTISGYNVYSGSAAGGTKTKANTAAVATTC